MKLFILSIALTSFFVSNSSAQQSKSFTVQADEVNETTLKNKIYLYPAFVNGQVYFKDGTSAAAKLNYNLLIDEIKFIDPKGDTLGLDNESTINYIAIKPDTFYYNKGYLRQVGGNAKVKLVVQEKIKEIGKEKMGSYGQASSATNDASYTRVSDVNGQTSALSSGENIIFSRQTKYFLGDKANNFIDLTRKNLLKMYSANEDVIKDYLKDNSIDFAKGADMKKLVAFLQTLKN